MKIKHLWTNLNKKTYRIYFNNYSSTTEIDEVLNTWKNFIEYFFQGNKYKKIFFNNKIEIYKNNILKFTFFVIWYKDEILNKKFFVLKTLKEFIETLDFFEKEWRIFINKEELLKEAKKNNLI